MKHTALFGFEVYTGSTESLAQAIVEAVQKGETLYQASLNASKLALCRRSDRFRDTLRGFDVLSADGMSVVWASRLCGARTEERVAGIDLMDRLLGLSTVHSIPIYLLGARGDVLERAAAKMLSSHPSLRIAGTHHGYFDARDEDGIVSAINQSGAKILFVGMGSPGKEELLARQRPRLKVRFAMGVGGAYDIWAGDVPRASVRMQRYGLEWFHRMLQEPRRLAGRYLHDNALFALVVARELMAVRRRRVSHAQRTR